MSFDNNLVDSYLTEDEVKTARELWHLLMFTEISEGEFVQIGGTPSYKIRRLCNECCKKLVLAFRVPYGSRLLRDLTVLIKNIHLVALNRCAMIKEYEGKKIYDEDQVNAGLPL